MCQITTDMLTLMTGAANDTMPTTVTVQHATVSQSTLRTAVRSYATTAFTTTCRITSADMKGLSEQMRTLAQNSKYVGKKLSRLIFPGGTDLRLDDQVTEPISGRTFKLLSIDSTISYPVTNVALAVEFDGV